MFPTQEELQKKYGVNYTVDNNYTVIFAPESIEQSLSLAGDIEVALLAFIFMIGGPLSLYAFIKAVMTYMDKKRVQRSPVLLLRIHLNIADLLTLYIFVPRQVLWMTIYQWHGGVLLCKLCAFFSTFCFYLNAFIICSIAIQRLITGVKLSVVNALEESMRRVKRMLYISYFCAFLFSTPQLIIWQITMPYPKFTQCAPIWSIMAHETSTAYFGDITPVWLRNRITSKMDRLKTIETVYNYLHLIAIYWFPVICIAASYAHLIRSLTRNMRQIQRDSQATTSLVVPKVIMPTNRMAVVPIGFNICAACPVHNPKICDIHALNTINKPTSKRTVPTVVCCCNEQAEVIPEPATDSTPIASSSDDLEMVPLKTLMIDEEEEIKTVEELMNEKVEQIDVVENVPCHIHIPPPPLIPKRVSPAMITIQKARKQAMRQATLILLAYVTFWSPYQILSMFNTYYNDEERHKSFLNILNAIICANTIANPIIYDYFDPPHPILTWLNRANKRLEILATSALNKAYLLFRISRDS